MMFTYSVLYLFSQVLLKNSIWHFGVTWLMYRQPTRGCFFFLFQLKDERSQASNPHFGFISY